MLKPYYSSVDLTEVELPDSENIIDEKLEGMKKDMIDRKIGWKSLDVKIHLDSLVNTLFLFHSIFLSLSTSNPHQNLRLFIWPFLSLSPKMIHDTFFLSQTQHFFCFLSSLKRREIRSISHCMSF